MGKMLNSQGRSQQTGFVVRGLRLGGVSSLTMEVATLTGSVRSQRKECLPSLRNASSRGTWTLLATCSGYSTDLVVRRWSSWLTGQGKEHIHLGLSGRKIQFQHVIHMVDTWRRILQPVRMVSNFHLPLLACRGLVRTLRLLGIPCSFSQSWMRFRFHR